MRFSTPPATRVIGSERALKIEPLSAGWRGSFEALLRNPTGGNAGLAPEAAAHPTAPGFKPVVVTAIDRESADVLSLTMQSADGQPLPQALPGQYVVLRLKPVAGGRPSFRSYSLGTPRDRSLSNQRQDRAARNCRCIPAGPCPHRRPNRRQRARRGSFILQTGERPGRAAQRRHRADASAGHVVRARARAPHAPCCGSIPLATGNIIRSRPKFGASR